MTRQFDPPLTYKEVGRVYDFTNKLLARLGMAQWRMQILTEPAPKGAGADIKPMAEKYVGELRLGRRWMHYSVEDERIPTLVHEVLHLVHRELTDWWTEDAYQLIGKNLYRELDPRYIVVVERWVDHMTQVLLGLLRPEIEQWAAEIWGRKWREIGDP